MENLSREQLEKMVDVMATLLLALSDADLAEKLLRDNGFETEELRAIGFDVEEA